MTVTLVDYRVGLTARRPAPLKAALALAGVLNSSRRSHQPAPTALAGPSRGLVVGETVLLAVAGFPGSATTAGRELDRTSRRIHTGDVPERLDPPTGVSS